MSPLPTALAEAAALVSIAILFAGTLLIWLDGRR